MRPAGWPRERRRGGWQPANANHTRLGTESAQTVEADRSRRQHPSENLYRNAVEHGDDVTVSAGATDDGSHVAETEPGVPDPAREEVLRSVQSRSTNDS